MTFKFTNVYRTFKILSNILIFMNQLGVLIRAILQITQVIQY